MRQVERWGRSTAVVAAGLALGSVTLSWVSGQDALMNTSSAAQAPAPVTSPLWPDGPPGVPLAGPGTRPTLTLHQPPPAKATGAVVVVCPGGGYGVLAAHEADPIAEWLNSLGITAVVLRYRLGPSRTTRRCLKTPPGRSGPPGPTPRSGRSTPTRVGILGFSAGGPPGLDGGHPLRRREPPTPRPDRPAKLAARPTDPGLPGDLDDASR